MMETIRKFKVAIGIVVIILVLVVIRLSGKGFMPDAEQWAAPSLNNSNIVTSDQAAEMKGNGLLINLDNSEKFKDNPGAVKISPDIILDKENLRMIRRNKGPVILFSEDPSISSGTWMVLSQVGIRNLYILSDTKDDETIKNEFRPDTLVKPEL